MSFFKKNITSQAGSVDPSPFPFHKRSLVWIGMAILALALKETLPSGFWDHWYYHGLFGWIRQSYDFLLGWSPIPMVYIVSAVILVRFARWIGEWKKGWIYQVTNAIGGFAAIVTIFYLAWGFNYGQVSLQDRLGFKMTGARKEDIESEFHRATSVLMAEAEALPSRLTRDEAIASLKINDGDLRPDVVEALSILGLPHKGTVRVRQLWPAGFLLRWSTAGIYLPPTGEGHIDKGLLSVQKPFTIAHEMAHGYGITDEGACNFIAWLACSQSRDQWIRFGGALTYWRYAAAEMPYDSVSQVIHTLPPVVLRAITMVRENDKKYPDLMPQVRDAIYSSYLKSNGVHDGLRSYNEVVLMVVRYLQSGRPVKGKE